MMIDDQELNGEDGASLTAGRNKRTKQENGEGILTVDVYQNDEEIVIKSTIAGAGKDDIDISVANDMVTIKGQRKSDERIRTADYFYQELYWGPFSRSIILPEDVDADAAKASINNGILTLRLPKLSKTRTKKIKISS